MNTSVYDISFVRDFCINCGHYHRKENLNKPFDCMLGHDCNCKEKHFAPRKKKGCFA